MYMKFCVIGYGRWEKTNLLVNLDSVYDSDEQNTKKLEIPSIC